MDEAKLRNSVNSPEAEAMIEKVLRGGKVEDMIPINPKDGIYEKKMANRR